MNFEEVNTRKATLVTLVKMEVVAHKNLHATLILQRFEDKVDRVTLRPIMSL
jgi:hypothetical protein